MAPASDFRALSSSVEYPSVWAGIPNQPARTARWAAGISSIARPTLSSLATTVPARTVAIIAAPAATPAAARSAVGARLAMRTDASLSG